MKSIDNLYHYSFENFVDGLTKSGIEKGDTIFCHSNISFFGNPLLENPNNRNAADLILSAIFKIIGKSGTLILPSYTYSFCNSKIFDPLSSKGIGGLLSETLRSHKDSIRSLDPSISVVAKGKKAKLITQKLPEDSYSNEGIFGRLLAADTKICNFNFDASSTFLHYVEKLNSVPYRFNKVFYGQIKVKGKTYNKKSIIYVRYLHPCTEINMKLFDKTALKEGACKKINVGRGFIKTIKIRDQKVIANQLLSKNIWSLTKGYNITEIPDYKTLRSYK